MSKSTNSQTQSSTQAAVQAPKPKHYRFHWEDFSKSHDGK